MEMTQQLTWLALGSWWVYLPDSAITEPPHAERPTAYSTLSGSLLSAGVKTMKAGGTIRKKAGWNKHRKSKLPATDPAPGVVSPTAKPAAAAVVDPRTALRTIKNLREVPCTLEDVAWSPTLQDRDRGYLGSFLRFVSKCTDPTDPHHTLYISHLSTPLSTFITKNYPLPASTIASLHSLTLLPTPPHKTPLSAAIPRLTSHLASLGRIADARSSAALTTAYGASTELCQVLSRAAAVSGALNVLQRSISSHTTTPAGIAAVLSSGETVTAEYMITSAPPTHSLTVSKAVYIINHTFPELFAKKHETDNIAPAAVVLTFPSGSVDEAPVYAHIRGEMTCEVPGGEAVVYMETLAGEEVLDAAIERLMEEVGGEVLVAARYTQDAGGGEVKWEEDGRVVRVPEGRVGVLFDEGVVEECKAVWRRVVGEEFGKGFCVREKVGFDEQ